MPFIFLRSGNPLILLLALGGCADTSPQGRWQHADQLISIKNWEKLPIPAGAFMLSAYLPKSITHDDTLTVYIEGDGYAWLTGFQASDDPTPRNPIGLELALRHPDGNAVYLARPCQYATDLKNCQIAYWTNRRFAPEVIESSSEAITVLKNRFGASRLVLVGYSGGGAIAALVAARRQDVIKLITVAGTLDHLAWTQQHHVQPLVGSLNPADEWQRLENLPQLHFIGKNDKNMSEDIAHAFIARFPKKHRPEIRVMPDFDHSCCWIEQWQKIFPPLFLSK